jgi:hypothetical protein
MFSKQNKKSDARKLGKHRIFTCVSGKIKVIETKGAENIDGIKKGL